MRTRARAMPIGLVMLGVSVAALALYVGWEFARSKHGPSSLRFVITVALLIMLVHLSATITLLQEWR
jgi:hypothetical protein